MVWSARDETPSGNSAATHTTDHENLHVWGNAFAPYMFIGTGSPEAAVTAPVGSLFHRTDGGTDTSVYVKESGAGNTGWAAIQASTGQANIFQESGSGSPEGVVTAVVGTIFHRTDGGSGTTLFIKESGTGNTGWVAVNSSGSGPY